MSFNIPLDWITSWLNWVDSSAIDTGWSDPLRPDSALTLLLSAPSANDRILRFRSRSATSDSLRPRLLIYAVIKDSAEDVPHSYLYSLAAGGDLFEAWDANPLPLGRLVLGGGAGIRSAIKFDLAPIWSAKAVSDIVINRAIVTLHRDSTLYTWAPLSRWVWPYVMTSNLWMSQFASAEYAGYAASADSLNVAAGLIALKATSPTASWAKSDTVNFGLMLQAGSEALDLERVAYYGISSPDSTLWPKLTIYYTELPR